VPSTDTSWYWASPFHGQLYGVSLSLKSSDLSDDGGK
jgi:hypothetical protein